jgi:hypothetical protein
MSKVSSALLEIPWLISIYCQNQTVPDPGMTMKGLANQGFASL